MKKAVFFFLLFFSATNIYSKIPVSDQYYSSLNIKKIITNTHKAVIIGKTSQIEIFENGKWNNIPEFYQTNNGIDTAKNNFYSDIEFDKYGKIWKTGNFLSKYDGNKWTRYMLDDSLAPYREYRKFAIDSNGIFWICTYSYLVDTVVAGIKYGSSYHEVLKFNGSDFQVVSHETKISGYLDVQVDRNNRVFVHRFARGNDLMIFDNKGNISYETIQSPYGDSTYKDVTGMIFDTRGNLWVCTRYSHMSYKSGGLYVKNQSGWKMFNTNDGWRLLTKDELLPCMAIAESPNGYWVSNRRGLLRIDRDFHIVPIDTAAFMNQSIYYRHDYYLPEPPDSLGEICTYTSIAVDDSGKVWITSDNGIIMFDSKEVNTGVNDSSIQSGLPNLEFLTSAGELAIKNDKGFESEPSVSIYNLNGSDQRIDIITLGSDRIVLNTGSFASGIYFVSVKTGQYTVTSKVLISK